MRASLLIFSALLASLPPISCSHLSEEVVRSEMTRSPQASWLDGMGGKLKWNYTTGLELLAMLEVYEKYGDESILEYVDSWYDAIILEDGTPGANYKKSNYTLDHICPARTVFKLYDLTGKEKYRLAMEVMMAQIKEQPRTPEGGFWHKKVYPGQMWLDGLYMAEPFYAEYTARYTWSPEAYEDIVGQFLLAARQCYDPSTGLYRHAWDSTREMFWCDPLSGQSAHAWGRALGWFVMAMVETLPFIPEQTAGREELLGIFRGIFERLPQYADPQTGMWYQVLDCPGRDGNYVEATCSAMFTYSMLKGVRLGYLPESMGRYARECYRALLDTFVRTGEDGLVELTSCCSVAGLGGKENRSGDYDYYINEKVTSNDPKGIGPLVWAALEMER